MQRKILDWIILLWTPLLGQLTKLLEFEDKMKIFNEGYYTNSDSSTLVIQENILVCTKINSNVFIWHHVGNLEMVEE